MVKFGCQYPRNTNVIDAAFNKALDTIYTNIQTVTRTLLTVYNARYVVLILQTMRFNPLRNIFFLIVNKIIEFVATTEGVCICPPLMSPVMEDFSRDKVHHSVKGIVRLFCHHHKLCGLINQSIFPNPLSVQTLSNILSEQIDTPSLDPSGRSYGQGIPRVNSFVDEHYERTRAGKYLYLYKRQSIRPYHFAGKSYQALTVTITDSMFRPAMSTFDNPRRLCRHGGVLGISPGASYAHWAINLRHHPSCLELKQFAPVFMVSLGTNDVFYLEKTLKRLKKRFR